jgi:hypothetical protein
MQVAVVAQVFSTHLMEQLQMEVWAVLEVEVRLILLELQT